MFVCVYIYIYIYITRYEFTSSVFPKRNKLIFSCCHKIRFKLV